MKKELEEELEKGNIVVVVEVHRRSHGDYDYRTRRIYILYKQVSHSDNRVRDVIVREVYTGAFQQVKSADEILDEILSDLAENYIVHEIDVI